ncbi:hypothetical protein BS78_07G168700 [Paspalum vaginatum]|nr:hypothetical protein BS78_07G168700 [Paspalum vaginatum]
MALEAEGFFGCWPPMAAAGGGWSWGHGGGAVDGMMAGLDGGAAAAFWDVGAASSSSVMMLGAEEPAGAGSPSAPLPLPENGGGIAVDSAGFAHEGAASAEVMLMPPPPPAARRKRRRSRSVKNKEEVESQRMTHIAVERNRRKQMNEYLAVLRSLMPPSYVQRGDQASIIGGAINYVKEMEQLLQSLEARKHARPDGDHPSPGAAPPFAGCFTFPQYAMRAADTPSPAADDGGMKSFDASGNEDSAAAAAGSRPSAVADVEVTMVESHANLKVLSRRRPRQLLRLVAGLQAHRLTVLHLNVTSAGRTGLYSLSLKVEDDCSLASVDDIAAAVHRIVEAIEQEEQQQEPRK